MLPEPGNNMSTSNRHIPGTIKVEGIEVSYIQISQSVDFKKVTTFIKPSLPKSGGVSEDGCYVTTPQGERLYAIVYHSDIEGWRKQIEQGAEQLGLLTGKISENKIELSDGRIYALSDCKIEFY